MKQKDNNALELLNCLAELSDEKQSIRSVLFSKYANFECVGNDWCGLRAAVESVESCEGVGEKDRSERQFHLTKRSSNGAIGWRL